MLCSFSRLFILLICLGFVAAIIVSGNIFIYTLFYTTDCSKMGKEYVKAVYCHPAYVTCIQNTSCKMLGWMKHKLESRLLGEILITSDFPGGSDGKASAYNSGDPGSISELGRSPGEGNGNPLQYSHLENPIDGGVW